MQKPIFRQAALDRLASPEQLDQLMPVTSLRGWLALLALLALAAAVLAWSLLDRVPVQVSGRGILIHGGQVLPMAAPAAGVVEALLIRAGDEVQAGQVIARLRPAAGEPGAVVEVASLFSGRVLETLTAPGNVLNAGARLATLEDTHQPLEAVLYVPAAAAGDLRPGQPVQLAPDSVSRAAHGYLAGTLRAVGAFPASAEAMRAVLANDRLVAAFSAGGALIEVRVAVPVDAAGAYRWSSGNPPADPPLGGAVCTGLIITAERRPIEWLWPGR